MYTEAGGTTVLDMRGHGIWERKLDLWGFLENSEWEDSRLHRLYKEFSIYLIDNTMLSDRDVTQ